MNDLFVRFQDNLTKYGWNHKKILVALSGGLDSMTLASLLYKAGLTIELVHCNFKLRGAASDEDENLVKQWAAEKKIPLHIQHFDTRKIIEEQGGNLEATARNLRYDWFEQLRAELDYDLIAVAQHQEDDMETLLINFFKGTGIAGMHGILPERKKIIRPLLPFSKIELKNYALENQVPWREDESNASNDYLRNQIRHTLLPQIETIFPQAKQALLGNINRMRDVETLYVKSLETYRKKLLQKKGADFYIPILKLKQCPAFATILYEMLKPFGFSANQLPEIVTLLDAPSGKWLENDQYKIIKDRKFIIIASKETQNSTFFVIEQPEEKLVQNFDDHSLKIEQKALKDKNALSEFLKHKGNQELISLTSADFPLILRLIKDGDYFYPIGMGRKKKKVLKFLRDQKIPLHEKGKVWVLESHCRIVWVLGFRLDERFKVNEKNPKGWLFSLSKKDTNPTKK